MNGKLTILFLVVEVLQIVILMHKFFQEKKIEKIRPGGVAMRKERFHDLVSIYNSALLFSVVHAAMSPVYPEFSYEVS